MGKHTLMEALAVENKPRHPGIELFHVAIQDPPRQRGSDLSQVAIRASKSIGNPSHSKARPDGGDVIVVVARVTGESSEPTCCARRQQIEQCTAHARTFKRKADIMFVKILFQRTRETLVIPYL